MQYAQYADALAYRRWVQKTTGAAGVGLSVAASGSVAVTEAVIIPTLAVAGGAALCGSLLALETAASSNGQATGDCLEAAMGLSFDVIAESSELDVTRATWQATADWRRQSYDDLALPLLDSIACSLESGNQYDLDQARIRLRALRADSGIWSHLAQDTRIRALQLIQQVDASGRA